ncbi:hypothetical protein GCM10009787_33260 [Streptomyces bangladeshensis]|uniref:Uncharacterized protein n=1 Tax=Streptomyces bangladeshensis TaxID=295352 RepID=A0ABN3BJN7_9ACTN
MRFLELVRDRRIELELAVVFHAQIVPSGASCRLRRVQLPPQMAFQALAADANTALTYPNNSLRNMGSWADLRGAAEPFGCRHGCTPNRGDRGYRESVAVAETRPVRGG